MAAFKEYVRTDADLSLRVKLLKTSLELIGENNDTIVRPERIVAIFEELKQTYQGHTKTRINTYSKNFLCFCFLCNFSISILFSYKCLKNTCLIHIFCLYFNNYVFYEN